MLYNRKGNFSDLKNFIYKIYLLLINVVYKIFFKYIYNM